MDSVLRFIPNIAVSVFALVVGFKMWFSSEGAVALFALAIILISVSALETNIMLIIKERRIRGTGKIAEPEKTSVTR